MRNVYTLLSAALALFSVAGSAEAPRVERVDTAINTRVVVTEQGPTVSPASTDGNFMPGAITHNGILHGFAIDLPATVPEPSVGGWCCSSNFSSLGAATLGQVLPISALAYDGPTVTFDMPVIGVGGAVSGAVSEGASGFQTPVDPGKGGPFHGPEGGVGIGSVPTTSTFTENGSGTANWGPALQPESVAEPKVVLLLASAFVGLGFCRHALAKHRGQWRCNREPNL